MRPYFPSKYTCSGCDWSCPADRGGFLRVYMLPSGLYLHMERENIWCLTCQMVQPCEKFPEVTETEARIADAQAKLGGILQHAKRRPWCWLSSNFRERVRDAREALEYSLGWREFFAVREGQPRCLSCGQTKFLPFHPESRIKLDSGGVQLLMNHPGCLHEGKLILHLSQTWMTYANSLTYTPEGLEVGTVPSHESLPRRWR